MRQKKIRIENVDWNTNFEYFIIIICSVVLSGGEAFFLLENVNDRKQSKTPVHVVGASEF